MTFFTFHALHFEYATLRSRVSCFESNIFNVCRTCEITYTGYSLFVIMDTRMCMRERIPKKHNKQKASATSGMHYILMEPCGGHSLKVAGVVFPTLQSSVKSSTPRYSLVAWTTSGLTSSSRRLLVVFFGRFNIFSYVSVPNYCLRYHLKQRTKS